MRAALRFLRLLESTNLLLRTATVNIDLYGSLALTGIGHGTDRAILLGLMGEMPDEVDPATIEAKLAEIREHNFLRLLGKQPVIFNPQHALVFRRTEVLPGHSN